MENSSTAWTDDANTRRLANVRSLENQPSLRVFEGYAVRRESESFRKASGSFSFENRAPSSSSSSSLLVGGIVISRAEKTTRLFFTGVVVSFPQADGPSVIATDRKQRIDTFAFASNARPISHSRFHRYRRRLDARAAPIFRDQFGTRSGNWACKRYRSDKQRFAAVSAGEKEVATIERGIYFLPLCTRIIAILGFYYYYSWYTYICIGSCYIVGTLVTRLVTILNKRYECKGLN